MKKWLFIFIVNIFYPAYAQQWIALGGTSYNQYYVQEGSLRIQGSQISMTSQNVNRINSRILYMNSFTSVEACQKKQGSISFYALDNKAIAQGMFALGGRDPYSLIGTAICATHYNYELANKNTPTIANNNTVSNKSTHNPNTPSNIPDDMKKNSPHIKNPQDTPKNADDIWQRLAANEKSDIAIKTNSFTNTQIKGQQMLGVTGRSIDLATKKVSLVNWFVSRGDCEKQQGRLFTVNIDGSNSYDNNFVAGSGSMASIIAERVCQANS